MASRGVSASESPWRAPCCAIPAILILDEATSAVDIQDEVLIRKAIEEFAKTRTTFLISHSLASIQVADRIVLLDGGKIEAIGTDYELEANIGPLSSATRNSLPPGNGLNTPLAFACNSTKDIAPRSCSRRLDGRVVTSSVNHRSVSCSVRNQVAVPVSCNLAIPYHR